MKRNNERSKDRYTFPWYLVAVFLLLTAGISISGMLFYEHQKQEIKREKQDDLSAIADLKVRQLSAWRRERLGDAETIYANPILRRSLVLWLKGDPSPQLRRDITSWFESLISSYGYARTIVFTTNQRRSLSVPDMHEPICPLVRKMISQGSPPQSIVFLDLHRSAPGRPVEMGLIIPIPKDPPIDTTPSGYISLEIDPKDFLFPLIQSWPTPSKTAETLLVRREGNEVLYLNELRHRKNTALALRYPITRQDLPAAMAVRGFEGVMEGYDYRGKAELAAVKRVPDSPWFIVAKVDQEEIYAPIRRTALMTVLALSFMIVTAGACVGFWYRGQQAQSARRQLVLEHERLALVQHFDYLVRHANDIIILADADHRIVEANERAVETYGYSRDELIGMDMMELRTPEARNALEDTWSEADRQNGLIYETTHRRKDGTTFPLEISMRVIEVEGMRYFQGIARDISEKKAAERRLLHANRLYAVLSQVNQTIVRTRSRDILFREVCRIATEYGEFRMALIGLVDPDAHLFRAVAASGAELSFFNKVLVSSEDTPQGQSPIGIAIRENRIVASNDLFNYPGLFQWRGAAQELGCAASAAAPLVMHGRAIGAFSIYSSEPGFFDTDEIGLLDEIAQDISYALENIDKETQRVQAEKALQTSETKYHRLHDSMTDAFVWTDMEGRIVECNGAYRKMLGYGLEELSALTYRDITPEKWHAFEDEIVTQQIIPKGYSGIYEKEYRKKDGTVFPVELRTFLLKDDAGNPSGMWAIVRDITERKHSEMALHNQMEFLETMINTIPTPIYYKDAEGVYLGCNMQFASMIIGLPKERIIGRTILDLTETIPPEIAQRYHAQDIELIHIPGFRVYDEAISCPEGTVRNYVFSKATYTDSQGHVSGMVGIMMDISERKQVEQELKESERNLSIRNTIAEIFLTCPVEEMYGEVLKVLLDITRSKHGLFGFMDEEMTLVVPSFIGNIENARISEKTLRIPWAALSGEIIGQAIAEKKVCYPTCRVRFPKDTSS